MTISFSNVTFSGGLTFIAPPPPPSGGDPYWSNVVLLFQTSSSNNLNNITYIDSSNNNLTLTPAGTIQASFSPYPVSSNTVAYSPANNGGSISFTGDNGWYVSAPNNAALMANTGDFTIETWVYPQGGAVRRNIAGRGTTSSTGWELYLDASRNLFASTSNVNNATNVTLASNTWTHIAWSRSGSNSNIYVNGNLATTINDTTNYNQANILYVGAGRASGGSNWNGYISDFHFVKGTALYTANFSVPTQPISKTANTQLLITANNAGIYDAAQKNVLDTSIYIVTSNTQAKFGTTSIKSFGWPTLANPVLNFGTENFTVECWLYDTAGTGTRTWLTRGGLSTGYSLFLDGTDNVCVRINNTTYTSNGQVPQNQWTHVAFTRQGNNANIYVGGNLSLTANIAGFNNNGNENMYFGANATGGSTFIGYIDELRMTKGVARYTTNFSVPTAAFPAYYGT